MRHKALPPFANGSFSPMQAFRNLSVAFLLSGPQHQLGTGDQGVRQGARGGQTSQLGLFVSAQDNGGYGATGWHAS
jgi:hypothetical protein